MYRLSLLCACGRNEIVDGGKYRFAGDKRREILVDAAEVMMVCISINIGSDSLHGG